MGLNSSTSLRCGLPGHLVHQAGRTSSLETVLAQGIEDGGLHPLPVKPLAHILLYVTDEAALYVDAAKDRDEA